MSRPRVFRKVARLGAAVIALCVANAADAQQAGSRRTRDFVQAAAQSDQFEILEAETVLALSKDADIRAFATHMLEDHQRTSAVLAQATVRSGLEPPGKGISDDQARFLNALQSLTGAEFDTTYARQQVLAYSSALAVEQTYAASGDDTNVRGAATATVGLIQAHLAMIGKIAASRGAG